MDIAAAGEKLARNDQLRYRRRELDFGEPLRRQLEQYGSSDLLFPSCRSAESQRRVCLWTTSWPNQHQPRIQYARVGDRRIEGTDAGREREVLQAAASPLVEVRA